jgi:hypothetical protein
VAFFCLEQEMTISYAMLLDGGFIRHKLSTAQKPVDAAGHGTRIGLKEHADLVFDQYPLPPSRYRRRVKGGHWLPTQEPGPP